MTENTDTETRTEMKAVDHTHPDTDRPFGEQVVFARGPTVAADGGARDEERETDADAEETVGETGKTRMKDVDHEPPNEEDPNRVFERGEEGRGETR